MNQYAPPQSNIEHTAVSGVDVTAAMIESLRNTKGWVRLVSIVLFLGAALSALGGLSVGLIAAVGGTRAAAGAAGPAGMMVGIAVLYIVFGVLYGVLAYYLFQYASSIGRLLAQGDVDHMEAALAYQQKFWKIAGVLVLIMLIVFALGIIAAIAVPAMFGGAR